MHPLSLPVGVQDKWSCYCCCCCYEGCIASQSVPSVCCFVDNKIAFGTPPALARGYGTTIVVADNLATTLDDTAATCISFGSCSCSSSLYLLLWSTFDRHWRMQHLISFVNLSLLFTCFLHWSSLSYYAMEIVLVNWSPIQQQQAQSSSTFIMFADSFFSFVYKRC